MATLELSNLTKSFGGDTPALEGWVASLSG